MNGMNALEREFERRKSHRSGFSRVHKFTVGLAWGTLLLMSGAILQFMPLMYITQYGGSAVGIGFAEMFFSCYDVAFGPLCGFYTDKGSFNVGCFRDIEQWGRRMPTAMFAVPVTGLGCFLSLF